MPLDRRLAAELARMAKRDQEIRNTFGTHRSFPPPEQMMELARVDVANADRLREILDRHGWPGRSLVGKRGAENAWLLAQHADHQLDLQRRALQLLDAAVSAGEAEPQQLAYLTDRVRMNEGRAQVYGTQLIVDGGGATPWPLESPAEVDGLRAGVGLGPLAEYVEEASATAA